MQGSLHTVVCGKGIEALVINNSFCYYSDCELSDTTLFVISFTSQAFLQ